MVEPDLPPPEEGEELGVAAAFDDYPIVDRVLDYMEHDPENEEEYTFLVTGRAAVAELLDQIFSNVDVHPSGPIDDLLRLACAMETEYRSPSAAAEIKSALAADARVRDVLSAIEAEQAEWIRSAAVVWGVRAEVGRAPWFGAEAPEGTIKVRSFVDPWAPRVRSTREEDQS